MDGFNVLVVDDEGIEAPAVKKMFKDNGFDLTDDIYDANVVVFVGGEDVHPGLYRQKVHKLTHYNKSRDEYEKEIFNEAFSLGIPMAGICRGGQFLNVMSGGKMWQDVDNHNIGGTHKVWVKDWSGDLEVNSVHHQMMEPDWYSDVHILMKAGESTVKHAMAEEGSILSYPYSQHCSKHTMTDIEALYYPHTRSLCFQPHPEYGHVPTKEVFFYFLSKYVFNTEGEEDAA